MFLGNDVINLEWNRCELGRKSAVFAAILRPALGPAFAGERPFLSSFAMPIASRKVVLWTVIAPTSGQPRGNFPLRLLFGG